MAVGVLLGRYLIPMPLGMVLGLILGVVLGLSLDPGRAADEDGTVGGDGDRPGEEPPPGGDQDGAILRALLWVLGGLALLLLLALVTAPELRAVPGTISGVLGGVLLAGVPGVLLLLAWTGRRRRIDAAERGERRP